MKRNISSRTVRVILYCFLLIVALIQIYPIFWVNCSSLKTNDELVRSASYAMPQGFFTGHYQRVFSMPTIPNAFRNSIIVTVLELSLEVILTCPFAYALTKLHFKSGPRLFGFVLTGMMIPTFVCLIPMFRMYNILGLRNTYLSLVLPQLGFGIPMSTYMYKSFMDFIPDSLLEAAEIDGASSYQSFFKIVVPMIKNATITILTYKFIYVWNEFTYANTFMTEKSMKTLPIMLKDFAGEYGMMDWGSVYAAITIAVLPTLLIYFILSKNVIEGISLGSVKM